LEISPIYATAFFFDTPCVFKKLLDICNISGASSIDDVNGIEWNFNALMQTPEFVNFFLDATVPLYRTVPSSNTDADAIKAANREILEKRPLAAFLIYRGELCWEKKPADDKAIPYTPSRRSFRFDLKSIKRIDGCAHMLFCIHSFANAIEGITSMLSFPYLTTRFNHPHFKETLFDRSYLSSWVPYAVSPMSYFNGNIFVGVNRHPTSVDTQNVQEKHEIPLVVPEDRPTTKKQKRTTSAKSKNTKSKSDSLSLDDSCSNTEQSTLPLYKCSIPVDVFDESSSKTTKRNVKYNVNINLPEEDKTGKQNTQITELLQKIPGLQNGTLENSDKYNIYQRSRKMFKMILALEDSIETSNLWKCIVEIPDVNKLTELVLLYNRDSPLLSSSPGDILNQRMNESLEKPKAAAKQVHTTTKDSTEIQEFIAETTKLISDFKAEYTEEENYTLCPSIFTIAESIKEESMKIQDEIKIKVKDVRPTNLNPSKDEPPAQPTKKRKIDQPSKSTGDATKSNSSANKNIDNMDLDNEEQHDKSPLKKIKADKILDAGEPKVANDKKKKQESSQEEQENQVSDDPEKEQKKEEEEESPDVKVKPKGKKKKQTQKSKDKNIKSDKKTSKKDKNKPDKTSSKSEKKAAKETKKKQGDTKNSKNIITLGSDDEGDASEKVVTKVNKDLSSDMFSVRDVETPSKSEKADLLTTDEKSNDAKGSQKKQKDQQDKKDSMY